MILRLEIVETTKHRDSLLTVVKNLSLLDWLFWKVKL